jgi:hypothetical protein
LEELADYYRKGLLEVRRSDNYAFICCPAMDEYISVGQQRQVYKDLKCIEFELCMDNVCQAVVYTKINNPHMMVMFAKMGYKPFHLSIKRNVLWFKKELQNV